MGLGPFEIVIIFFVALIFVGPKRLPEIARAIGRGMYQFRKAMQDLDRAVQNATSTEVPAPSKPEGDHPAPSETEMHETDPEDPA
jgi:TatA/E family protein of Tat protein translocase